MGIQAAKELTFQEQIDKAELALVDFSAVWCPPCKALLPILDELNAEYEGRLAILKVDCDESQDLAAEYGIMSMPTVIVFHRGEPVEKLIGLRPKSVYQSVLSRYL